MKQEFITYFDRIFDDAFPESENNNRFKQLLRFLLDNSSENIVDKKIYTKNVLLGKAYPDFLLGSQNNQEQYNDVMYELYKLSVTNAALTQDVISDVTGLGVNAGDTFVEGMTLTDVVIKLLSKIFYPTFVAPTLSLTNNVNQSLVEVGTVLDIQLLANFNRGRIVGDIVSGVWNSTATQNPRAGAATSYIINGVNTGLDSNITVDDYEIVYRDNIFNAVVNYGIGSQPKDSKENNYQSPLSGGSLNASTNVVGAYRRYAGSLNYLPTTGTQIRTSLLSTSVLELPSSQAVFTFNTGTTNRRFVIAIPSDRELIEVRNMGTNENLTNQFIRSTSITKVPDAANFQRNYWVYIMENAVPFSTDYSIRVTLD